MRLKLAALGLFLPVATLLSGCAMGTQSTTSPVTSASKPITGKAFGGQQPVVGSTIALYAYGTSGYGSAGTLLTSTITDSAGYFTIDPASINCPTPNTPVYILSLGGNPGSRVNPAIALGSGLGACSQAANAFVTINEISTAALAYTFSHFFSATTSDGTTSDHFGAPASALQVVTNANSGTLPTLLDVQNGYPHPATSTFNFEGSKLITIANVIGACVNSAGPTSPACSEFFLDTTVPGSTTGPQNTLEAAVNLALYPNQYVADIFGIQPQSGASAFTGGLTSAPADWTLAASYTSPSFGLGVNTNSTSTIDVDQSGRVWFPSNKSGAAGIAFFDPSAGSFSSLYTAAGMQHPQQVAIDLDSYVWATDTASANVSGFPAPNPSSPITVTLPGTTSTSLTVNYDNSLRLGIVNSSTNEPQLASLTNKSTYAPIPNTFAAGAGGYIVASLAADYTGGLAVSGTATYQPTTYSFYYGPDTSITFVTYQNFEDAGQVAFTGGDYLAARGGYNAADDGVCIWSSLNCFPMANQALRHPSGASLDGAASLWLADNLSGSVEKIPLINNSYVNSSYQMNNTVFVHDSTHGATLPAPEGIAVDRAGNVWVSNYGCYGTGCTPGSFTLTEIIGAGAPTLTPVAIQAAAEGQAGTQPQVKFSPLLK
jgi:streptogramin lyase